MSNTLRQAGLLFGFKGRMRLVAQGFSRDLQSAVCSLEQLQLPYPNGVATMRMLRRTLPANLSLYSGLGTQGPESLM
jgi:hypothetical protein